MIGGLQFVVAGGNGPMLLEAVDGTLHDVAVPVGLPIEAHTAARFVGTARNDGPDATAAQIRPDRGAGVALVANHAVGADAGTTPPRAFDGPALQQRWRLRCLVALPGGQHVGHRLAASLGTEVDFGREATAGATEGLIATPFCAPAACWWARTVVLSRKCRAQSTSPAAWACACNVARARSHTPACCQRRKREYTVRQGPNRCGRSRQGTPVAKRQRMPSTMSRSSRRGRPRPVGGGGSSGRSRAHCSSLKACRSMRTRIVHFADRP